MNYGNGSNIMHSFADLHLMIKATWLSLAFTLRGIVRWMFDGFTASYYTIEDAK
jgi:hypothetical protein